jgi:hypothetical protein
VRPGGAFISLPTLGVIFHQNPPKKNLTGLWRFRYCPADLQIACATSVNLLGCRLTD